MELRKNDHSDEDLCTITCLFIAAEILHAETYEQKQFLLPTILFMFCFFFFCWMRAKDALFIAIVDWECINEIGQTKETSKHSLLYKDNTVRRAAFNLVQNKMYRQRSKPKKKENKERGIQVNLSYFYLFWSVLLASLSQLFLSTEQELHCYWMFWVSNWISIVRTIQLRPKQIFRLQITEMEWNMYI